MKTPALLLLTACAALAATTHANAEEAIYRCTDGDKVAFQWTNCAPGQQEKLVLAAPSPTVEPAAPAQDASAQAANAAPKIVRASWRAQVRSPAPYVGISDDAVLNMRGWGRPSKIERKRGHHAWLEHWSYQSPSGEARHLHFTNGKLVAINVEPAPYVVQLANAPVAGQGTSQ